MKITIYVRNEDEAAFNSINDRAEWLHKTLQASKPQAQIHGNLIDQQAV